MLKRTCKAHPEAVVLCAVALLAAWVAVGPFGDVLAGSRNDATGLLVLALAILVTACLCTAAVLVARRRDRRAGEHPPRPPRGP